jgi:hypothetical protein
MVCADSDGRCCRNACCRRSCARHKRRQGCARRRSHLPSYGLMYSSHDGRDYYGEQLDGRCVISSRESRSRSQSISQSIFILTPGQRTSVRENRETRQSLRPVGISCLPCWCRTGGRSDVHSYPGGGPCLLAQFAARSSWNMQGLLQ